MGGGIQFLFNKDPVTCIEEERAMWVIPGKTFSMTMMVPGGWDGVLGSLLPQALILPPVASLKPEAGWGRGRKFG